MRVVAIQAGPATLDLHQNLARVEGLIADLSPSPDLIVLPELFARPFWCLGLSDPGFFSWAEDLEGETLATMRRTARALDAHVVVPFFERGAVAGEFYNSAALIGPTGELIPGTLPSGDSTMTYRKNAVSFYRWDEQVNDEKFYFRPGDGFPVFHTGIGTLGILICYDRWFPEAWRVLALQGADIVCVINASAGFVSDMFVPSMRTCAAQNLLFVIASNRAGTEEVSGRTSRFYGLSCIVGPTGDLLAEGAEAEPDQVVAADVDIGRVVSERAKQTMFRDRRPELYGLITARTADQVEPR